MKIRKTQQIDFDMIQFSSRHYRLNPTLRHDKCILMTGLDVTKEFSVPFAFVLTEVHLYHMDTNKAASTDELQITLRRPAGAILETPHFVDDYYKRTDITNAKFIISFKDLEDGGLVFEAGKHQIILNSTDTDLVSVLIYIKELK